MSGKFVSQSTKYGVDDWTSVGAKEHGVALSCASFLLNSRELCLAQELSNWRFRFAILVGDVGQATRPLTFSNISKLVNLLTAKTGAIFDANRLDTLSVFEHAKFGVGKHIC